MTTRLAALLEPKTNITEVACLLSKMLRIKISDNTLRTEIEAHAAYPSLLSISDVYSRYGLDNLSIQFDQGIPPDTPTPFITQIKSNGKSIDFFTVVKEYDDNFVTYFDPQKHTWAAQSNTDFSKRCSNIVLMTDMEKSTGEKNYDQKVAREKANRFIQYLSILAIPFLLLTVAVFYLSTDGLSALPPILFCTLTLTGVFIGALLIWYDIDRHNSILQQICTAGKKTNCAAVLRSKGAKVFGVSWSIIGVSYFFGSLAFQLITGLTNPKTLEILSWLNLFATPYVLYSVYYQWRIAKSWCVLCLAIQLILILQCLVVLIFGWLQFPSTDKETFGLLLQAITAFSIGAIVIPLVSKSLFKHKESTDIRNEIQRLKQQPAVFEGLLQKQKVLQEIPRGLGLILGNANALYKIIKVCNPYCGPCATAHELLEELLDITPDLSIQIIFTATPNPKDFRNPPVTHLLALAESVEAPVLKQALNDWYRAPKKDYALFASKYPMNGQLTTQEKKIESMHEWCEKTAVSSTPTFFISLPKEENKDESIFHQLPPVYNISDLIYFFIESADVDRGIIEEHIHS